MTRLLDFDHQCDRLGGRLVDHDVPKTTDQAVRRVDHPAALISPDAITPEELFRRNVDNLRCAELVWRSRESCCHRWDFLSGGAKLRALYGPRNATTNGSARLRRRTQTKLEKSPPTRQNPPS